MINRLDEAVEIVRQIDSPAVASMFDVHNTAGETIPAAEPIAQYITVILHVHLNEMDGRRPGTGNYNFQTLFQALQRHNYSGWLSVEVFDFKADGETVAAQGFTYLRSQLPGRPGN